MLILNKIRRSLANKVFIGKKRPEYYNGLLMKADTGLHAQIANKISELSLPHGAKVLDYGAGEGALSERLSDMGYKITAADTDIDAFKCSKAVFDQVDFDNEKEFSNFIAKNTGQFDVVISVEVIEHVQDQWGYVRQLMSLVKPSGYLLITTPNTTSWLSRFQFFFKGQFCSFDDHGLKYGHINPISSWELSLMIRRCGAQDIDIQSAGTLPLLYLAPNRQLLIGLLVLPFRLFMRGIVDGWCVMATAQKPTQSDFSEKQYE